MSTSAVRAAVAIMLGCVITLSLSAETLSREAQMAIGHVRSRMPGVLSQCDERLSAAIDEAKRAQRSVIAPGQREPLLIDERGEYTCSSADARTDLVMSAEYLAALWSRRLDLVEQGLCFEALPVSVADWSEGDVGVVSMVGAFDEASDRLVEVVRVLGPRRVLARARIVSIDGEVSDAFVLDGLPTLNLRPGDPIALGSEPLAVVSVDVTIQAGVTTRTPTLRPVQLSRFGHVIAETGRDEVARYRLSHARPAR